MSYLTLMVAYVMAAFDTLESLATRYIAQLDTITAKLDQRLWGEARASRLTGELHRRAVAGELGIFGVLVFGAIALVVVSIILLFGMDIAGEFAESIDVNNDYSDQANSTVNSTGSAFELFGTSVLVIPAAAVLTVLIGGMLGAVTMAGRGANIPGAGRPGR